MLKKSASVVLASLKGSTLKWSLTEVPESKGVYPLARNHLRSERLKRSLVCTSSPLRSLRPRWTAFLSILKIVWHYHRTETSGHIFGMNWVFPQPANPNKSLCF